MLNSFGSKSLSNCSLDSLGKSSLDDMKSLSLDSNSLSNCSLGNMELEAEVKAASGRPISLEKTK